MEMSAGSQRLIREWDTSGGMEAHDCCGGGGGGGGEEGEGEGGGEAGLYQQVTLIHLPRQKQTRRRRMAGFSAVALVLLVAAALVLLFKAGQRWPGQEAADRQLATQPPSGHSYAQQQPSEPMNPRAMLTAPAGNNTVSAADGIYLEWENQTGKAFCLGGFSYSRGDLVVPRTGFYRVFVQITFQSKEVSSCQRGDDVLTLSYKVFELAKSYKRNVCLLSAVDTVKCNMEIWKKSLFTSGLFKLEADSRLRVSAPHHDNIVRGNEHQVFFGAELLPQ